MNNLFLLPKLSVNESGTNNVSLLFVNKDNYNYNIINKSLNYYLKNIKKQLDGKNDWDKFKKLTFSYEYISSRIDYSEKPICKYEPISRAFFKIYELIYNLDVLNFNNKINTFHLAEGPGGFIEATAYYRKNKNDNYYGMTLIDNKNKHVPNWDKCKRVMRKYQNIKILDGPSKNGDLFDYDNLNYVIENFGDSMDFITGDGGIDYSEDFNNQEQMTINLIVAQIIYALIMQKNGGHFILKIFDCFYENTINILYTLSLFYENVYICKPDTSRSANSERYIVCKNKKKKLTTEEIKNIKLNYHFIKDNNVIFKGFIDKPPCYNYLLKIEEINSILGQQQLENINLTLNYIFSSNNYSYDNFVKKNKEKIQNIVKTNITKCIKWCLRYKFQYNNVNYNYKNNYINKY